MVGFHLPGDPYFPNQGNVGRIDAEPEDNHVIPLDDDFAEDFLEDTDSEPVAYNPLPLAQNPNHHQNFQGPTPLWAINLDRWSEEQGWNHLYHGDRSFYNLEAGGSEDRALPVLVRRVSHSSE